LSICDTNSSNHDVVAFFSYPYEKVRVEESVSVSMS